MSRAFEAMFPFLLVVGGIAAVALLGGEKAPAGSLLSADCTQLGSITDPKAGEKYARNVIVPLYLKHRADTDDPEVLGRLIVQELNPGCDWDSVVGEGAPEQAVVWLCKVEMVVRLLLIEEGLEGIAMPEEVVACALRATGAIPTIEGAFI